MTTEVENNLLRESNLSRDDLTKALALIHQNNVDYADLYFQSSYHETWMLEDGLVKEGSYNIERGVGVRAVSGDKTGFSYSDAINIESLTQASTAAKSIAKASENKQVQIFTEKTHAIQFGAINPISSLSDSKKIELLHQIEDYIRQLAPEASQVISSISAVYEEILVAASDGTFATDTRPLIRMNCSVLLEKNGKRERGGAGGGQG